MKIKNTYDKLYGIIFSVYVGSGPIYWIPLVNLKIIDAIKYLLFFLIILWPIFVSISFNRLTFPGGTKVFLLFLSYIAFSVPSLLIGLESDSIYRILNTFQIFLFLFSCGFLIRKKIIEPVVYLAVRIFIFFCALSFFLMLIIPGYVNPLNEGLYLSQTGLGGSRTGWSPSIALYLPWLYSGFMIVPGYWVWIAALTMVANQVLVAGRTGMVAALVPFIFYGFFRKNLKIFLLMIGGIAFIVFFAYNNLELLRLDVGGFNNKANLDELSTGRTGVYLQAFNDIFKNPITGYGIGVNGSLGVHNVILRTAMEGGIPYALTVIGLFIIALCRGWRGINKKNWFVVSAFMTVLSGIVTSFFEPLAMFGSFNSAGFWWLCFAICVSASSQNSYQSIRSIK